MTMSTPCDDPAALSREQQSGPSSVDIAWHDSHWTLSGELDAYSAPALVAGFTRHLSRCENPDVRVDCDSLVFVDAGGLSALILVARHVRAAGRRFQIAPMGSSLARLLRLCAIADI